MRVEIDGHQLEIQDTGSPRGERNYWNVWLNGIEIFSGFSGKRAQERYEELKRALESKGARHHA